MMHSVPMLVPVAPGPPPAPSPGHRLRLPRQKQPTPRGPGPRRNGVGEGEGVARWGRKFDVTRVLRDEPSGGKSGGRAVEQRRSLRNRNLAPGLCNGTLETSLGGDHGVPCGETEKKAFGARTSLNRTSPQTFDVRRSARERATHPRTQSGRRRRSGCAARPPPAGASQTPGSRACPPPSKPAGARASVERQSSGSTAVYGGSH